jgi:hypothetical protein
VGNRLRQSNRSPFNFRQGKRRRLRRRLSFLSTCKPLSHSLLKPFFFSFLFSIYEFVCDNGRNVNIGNGAVVNNVQSEVHWPETERWLQRRHAEVRPGCEDEGRFRILGYQWRALRFNDDTRQSTVKVMAAYRESEPGSVFLMQQPHCLAVPCNPLTFFFPLCDVLL